jgi:acetyl-CoA carboxylase, biotin carboxylase subunit
VFDDSLIAKLVAWGSSRDNAIARMTRALGEYQVLGIRTTIPFFTWLMSQDGFRRGAFDTTWLDGLLASRRESFSELAPADEDLAAIAAAVDAYMRARTSEGTAGTGARGSLWKAASRREGLRA